MELFDCETKCQLASKYTIIQVSDAHVNGNAAIVLGDDPVSHAIVYRDTLRAQQPVKLLGESAARYLQDSCHQAVSSDLFIRSIMENSLTYHFAKRELFHLVLDGVVNLEYDSKYLSGQTAFTHLDIASVSGPASDLARISNSAISYVADLGVVKPETIESRLYWFNSRPIFPKREVLFTQHIDQMKDEIRRLMGGKWNIPENKNTVSLNWFDIVNPKFKQQRNDKVYKLYISTHPEALVLKLKAVLETIRDSRAFEMKIPSHPRALVRPDWFVVYFTSLQDLTLVAQELDNILDELPTQGVPFTCQIGKNINLSWAVEPPNDIRDGHMYISSWRLWVVRQLTKDLMHTDDVDIEDKTDMAKLRLLIDGVDTSIWAPPQEGWW